MSNINDKISDIATWKLFNNSDDALIVLHDNNVINTNVAADNLLNGLTPVGNKNFSLAGISPEFQPGGEPSAEYEKKMFDNASKSGFARSGWALKDKHGKELYVEITLIPSGSGNDTEHYLFLREMNEEVRMRQRFIEIQKDIDLKTKEVNIQNEEIESQKEIIETQRDVALKQRDEIATQKQAITDSIRYASRIQSALLPFEETFLNSFSDYFILYLPKDIIGGDFYWISKKHNITVVAAADCTGHGVPGALMSIMGMTFLDEIVNNLGIVQPDLILNNLRQRIINTLGQKGSYGETSDGMDIALFTIDYVSNKLQYSGAFNHLLIVRNDTMTELKADRMPLAYYTGINTPFTKHEFDISANDSIYIYSDGYSDQFGWREGKKYKLRRFKDLLMNFQDVPMKGQKVLLENELNNWKGDVDQLDDILVLGMQI
ncbi:MAG: SpoIIE family protein phosphatase [Bacteroidales bacterium]|nr:SpoIIE family protein phosphatase [Bacteroidales bacterium]